MCTLKILWRSNTHSMVQCGFSSSHTLIGHFSRVLLRRNDLHKVCTLRVPTGLIWRFLHSFWRQNLRSHQIYVVLGHVRSLHHLTARVLREVGTIWLMSWHLMVMIRMIFVEISQILRVNCSCGWSSSLLHLHLLLLLWCGMIIDRQLGLLKVSVEGVNHAWNVLFAV